MESRRNPYSPDLSLPMLRRLETLTPDEVPEAILEAGEPGIWSQLSYYSRKALQKLPLTNGRPIPAHFSDQLLSEAERFVAEWDHIHPSHDKMLAQEEDGTVQAAPYFTEGAGTSAVKRLCSQLQRNALYRRQMKAAGIDREGCRQLCAFALSLALGRHLYDEALDRGETMEIPFTPIEEHLANRCEEVARDLLKQVLLEAQGSRDKTANQLLEYVVRRLGVRWDIDHHHFHFTNYLWSEEGVALVQSLSRELLDSPLYRCLLGTLRAEEEDVRDLCRQTLEDWLHQILGELAHGKGILKVEQKVQAINSLDKQVLNILSTFEEVTANQWEFLTSAKRDLIEKQYANEAVSMVDERLQILTAALDRFEDLVGELGFRRLDGIALIKELQELCDQQTRGEIAERAMLDFIHLHPNYEWRTHAEVLQEQVADDLSTIISYCLNHIPNDLSRDAQSNFRSRLVGAERDLAGWTHAGCDPLTCQENLIRIYNEVQDAVSEEAPSLYTRPKSAVLSGLSLVRSLLETITTFFPFGQRRKSSV